jgi:hypothetical protein
MTRDPPAIIAAAIYAGHRYARELNKGGVRVKCQSNPALGHQKHSILLWHFTLTSWNLKNIRKVIYE